MYEQLFVDFGYRTDDRRASASSHVGLGDTCHLLDRNAEAMSAFLVARAEYQDLANRSPSDLGGRTGVGRTNFRIGLLQAEEGKKAAAEQSWITAAADFEPVVVQSNAPISAHAGLTAASAMQGKWTKAVAAGIKVVEASGRSCDSLVELALLQLGAGDDLGYRTSCAELVSRFGSSAADREARAIITVCVASDAATRDMPILLAMSQRMAASDPGNPIHHALLGAATCRAGQIAQGTEILERALPLCATAENGVSTARDQFRAIHVLSAMILARAYFQDENQQPLLARIDSLRGLIARYETALPRYDAATPPWLLGLALDLARHELGRLGDSRPSDPKSAAE